MVALSQTRTRKNVFYTVWSMQWLPSGQLCVVGNGLPSAITRFTCSTHVLLTRVYLIVLI